MCIFALSLAAFDTSVVLFFSSESSSFLDFSRLCISFCTFKIISAFYFCNNWKNHHLHFPLTFHLVFDLLPYFCYHLCTMLWLNDSLFSIFLFSLAQLRPHWGAAPQTSCLAVTLALDSRVRGTAHIHMKSFGVLRMLELGHLFIPWERSVYEIITISTPTKRSYRRAMNSPHTVWAPWANLSYISPGLSDLQAHE